jgi:hypothetical protein
MAQELVNLRLLKMESGVVDGQGWRVAGRRHELRCAGLNAGRAG